MLPDEMSFSRALTISQIASALETLADVMFSDNTNDIAGFEDWPKQKKQAAHSKF